MKEAFYPWKRALAPIMLLSVLAIPIAALFIGFNLKLIPVGVSVAIVCGMGVFLKAKPDWYECPKCGHKSHIFGSGGAEKMCRDYGTELLGQLPLDEAIRSQADSGKPTVVSDPDGPTAAIYRRIARRSAVKIAESQRDMTSKFPNIVVQNT